MNSFPQSPKFVNGKAITPAQHDRLYGGSPVAYDEFGLLLYAVDALRNGSAQPVVNLTDSQLAQAEAEAMFTDWRR